MNPDELPPRDRGLSINPYGEWEPDDPPESGRDAPLVPEREGECTPSERGRLH